MLEDEMGFLDMSEIQRSFPKHIYVKVTFARLYKNYGDLSKHDKSGECLVFLCQREKTRVLQG